MNRVKIWQQDEWKGQNMLVSLNKLDFNADTFDLKNNIININSLVIDHPLFSQYDYTGKGLKTPLLPRHSNHGRYDRPCNGIPMDGVF